MFLATSLGLPISFLIISAILLWFTIELKGKFLLKVFMVALAGLWTVVLLVALNSYQGWPTTEPMPDKFLVHWVKIDEPSKRTKEPGAIYLWVTSKSPESDHFLSFLGYQAGEGEPRAYKVPYSKGKHKQLQKVMKMLKKGKPVQGKRNKGKGKGKKGVPGKGNQKKKGKGSISQEQEFKFHFLPPPKLPEK